MSAINKALSNLSKNSVVHQRTAENGQNSSSLDSMEQEGTLDLQPAQIAKVKSTSPWIWVVMGFTLSLGVGGWAVSQQEAQVVRSHAQPLIEQDIASMDVIATDSLQQSKEVDSEVEKSTNKVLLTSKVVDNDVAIYSQPKPKASTVQATDVKLDSTFTVSKNETVEEGMLLAKQNIKAEGTAQIQPEPIAGTVSIEKVELTPKELAEQSVKRAEKALDSNELNEALGHYQKALRYMPTDEHIRQKLAALYYGKQDTRKSFDLIQEGIKLNDDSERLRLNLSQLLLRENQQEAALTPLVHLPPSPSIKYLSMRAALAQKQKQYEIALESYQALVQVDETNGRWWLGLGIQLERKMQFSDAKNAYQTALTNVGISSQSQSFIRDRLSVLKQLEESANAN